jgi:CheY-like chemotaxis protein
MVPADLPNLAGLTLLAVDDGGDSLEILGTYLRACGAHVLQARGALAALSYLDTQARIDVLITDLSMPSMDGVELLRRIRMHRAGTKLPAVALTGFYEQYMQTHGFDAFLRKPVDFDELCRTILDVTRR